jgi:hypothetical protein
MMIVGKACEIMLPHSAKPLRDQIDMYWNVLSVDLAPMSQVLGDVLSVENMPKCKC